MLQKIFITRNLALLWTGQVFGKFGESIFGMTLAFVTLELTQSGAATGLVQMSGYLPILIFGLFAGTVIDRNSKRRVMLTTDAGRAVLVALIPLLFYVHLLSAFTLALIAFAITSLSAFFVPARNAFVPELAAIGGRTDETHLFRSNSLIQTSEQIAFLAGPLAVGVLASLVGTVQVFFFTAAAFIISYLFITLISEPQREIVYAPLSLQETVRQSLDSLRKLRRNKPLWQLLVITSFNNLFLMGAAIVGTPLLIKQVLGKGIETFALIEFIFAAVMLAVSFLMNVYSKQVQQIGYLKIWAAGLVLDGFSYCPYYFVNSVPMLAAFAVLHASFIILIIIPRTTLIQRLAAKEELGNVFSLLNVAVSGMTAISVALTGWACEQFGIREVFMALGILSGATGIWAWITLVSNAQAFAATEPAAPEV